ncbi:uncharacterized protein At1g27050-like [Cornus florida]|uniref:uncharacterized protein At1g27050-like n=1 Tax=Cornus florida TaxID=4283 RepID=UPI00289883D0|nr:uncharacterized protein At1g27050-like [Cornus florida]
MSRKRDKPYVSRHAPYSFPKRRRPLPTPQPDSAAADGDRPGNSSAKSLMTVIVIGISPDCSVLDLKSRFEIYGGISRTRMDPGGVAYITFRSKDAADSAIAASLDPSFGITLNSHRVKKLCCEIYNTLRHARSLEIFLITLNKHMVAYHVYFCLF